MRELETQPPGSESAPEIRDLSARLRRAGFTDTRRAQALLDDDALRLVLRLAHRGQDGPGANSVPGTDHGALITALGATADPDRALLGLVRVASAAQDQGSDTVQILSDVLEGNTPREDHTASPQPRNQLLAILGGSAGLTDELVRHPGLCDFAAQPSRGERETFLHAVGAEPGAEPPIARDATQATIDALRLAYRTQLLRVSGWDLSTPDPATIVDQVGTALADLAAAALEAALAVARAGLPGADQVRFAIIGMGKCGGHELNYVSDVDVIYVVEPAAGMAEEQALIEGARIAAGITRVCSAPSGEPPLWPVDTTLRPEGADGPIVRTLASHIAYYERWARTWEFQALLKARPVAGDPELGSKYLEAINPFVWTAAGRENFVADSQNMRRRVEEHIPAQEAGRHLKLGKGGLRDIEFTAQLLQLVHGRADPTIRSPQTLEALAALAAGGYVGREDAARLDEHYRFLRVLEHRIQLGRLRRSHLLPTGEASLRRLGRSIGLRGDVVVDLLERVRATRRDVRESHEAMFFRPLLPAVASLTTGEATMDTDAIRARLAAFGYRDPAGALRHMRALTDGLSRTAAIQRQLLPAMLGWFARGAGPDAGLLGFRQLSDALGGTHWYLKLLRDSGTAAPRLAHLLASSAYMVDALARSPESVKWLADDDELGALTSERLGGEVRALLDRAADPTPDGTKRAVTTLRALRRRELARAAAAELLQLSDPVGVAAAITTVTDAVLVGTLELAERLVQAERRLTCAPTTMLIVAMGRLGGREPGYGSDADVLFVHDPAPETERSQGSAGRGSAAHGNAAQDYALDVAARVRKLLGEVGTEPNLEVDADLRPEGRNGPLVRSLDSFREYYARWGEVWESQALLRARPVAGDDSLGDRFQELIDHVRFPPDLSPRSIREIRRIKARVEAERLPRGLSPTRHLKLGPGGISDVEWTVQLLQLAHAHAHPELRTTSTLDALEGLTTLGLLSCDDATELRETWMLASGIRNALVLWTGRTSGTVLDVLPVDRGVLTGIARIMDYPAGGTNDLEEDFLRAARRARTVVQRVFYGVTDQD